VESCEKTTPGGTPELSTGAEAGSPWMAKYGLFTRSEHLACFLESVIDPGGYLHVFPSLVHRLQFRGSPR
jgi:hypothetical protein